MPEPSTVERLIESLACALQDQEIPYMLIGGQAVLVHGEPRMTRDIDINLGIDTNRLDQIIDIAGKNHLTVLVDDPEDFAHHTMVLPTLHEPSGFRVDFIFSFSPYEQQAIKRAKKVTIGQSEVHFTSLEDLIIQKIIAGRPRDIDDIISILLKKPVLDQPYIEHWLKQFEAVMEMPFLDTLKTLIHRWYDP